MVTHCLRRVSQGGFWSSIEAINDNFEYVGYSIIFFFACSAAIAAIAWVVRSRRGAVDNA